MIIAQYTKANNAPTDVLVMVLEPENLERMKQGLPIHKTLLFAPKAARKLELILFYTPDAHFVESEWERGRDLMEVLQASLSRPEIFRKGYDNETSNTAGASQRGG